MTFDWVEYLTLARCVVAKGDLATVSAESRFRCAAGRAYYAALCTAAAYLSADIGETPPQDHEYHEFVISRFRDAQERSWKRVGSWLDQLREHRRHADYDGSVRNWPSKADLSIALSEGAIRDLESIFGHPPTL